MARVLVALIVGAAIGAAVRKPADGASLEFQVRRAGQDLKLTLR